VSDPGLCSVLNGAVVNTIFHNVLVAFFPVYATTVGLGATQVGLVRALYSGINMVARPVVGIIMGRMSARLVTYVGLAVQGLLLLAIPFVNVFPLFMAVFAVSAFARAFVVVSNSVGLAEDVDETRVSRGVATSAYSAAPDVSNIVVPILAGAIASAVMVGPMFAIVGGGALASYAAVELAVARWRAARRAGTPVLNREPVG
jgi:MFS family permease